MEEVATTVLKQRCSITVDTVNSTITGHTELTVQVAEGANNINLHAQGMKIRSVKLNGTALAWGFNEPAVNLVPEEWKQERVKDSSVELARLSFLQYKHIRECTIRPNLCIKLPEVVKETSPKEMTIKIHYRAERPTGFVFEETCAFTRNDCFDGVASWMPCNQQSARHTKFDLEIAVPRSQIVVCTGQLIKTFKTQRDSLKAFHYQVSDVMCVSRLFLCIGKFDVHSIPIRSPSDDPKAPARAHLSCFGPKGSRRSIIYTMQMFSSIFQFIEDTVGTTYPFKNLKILFLPDVTPAAIGRHDCLALSSTLLLPDKRTIDHGLHHRMQIFRGLARVWFGAILMPKASQDQWLIDGLIGWLERKLILNLLGFNEMCYRRQQERRLVCEADNGSLPPLHPQYSISGLQGTEWYQHQEVFRWKCTAIMRMIEERVSHEAFKRVINRLVRVAADACRSGTPSNRRFTNTKSFLKEAGIAGGIRKELQAFAERWIFGCGCPTFTTEVGFEPKTYSMTLAMKQDGCESHLESTKRAVRMSKEGSIGLVKVAVSQATIYSEHSVQMGSESERDVKFKLQGRPRKRRRAESTIITENPSPIKWVRVNHDRALLATSRILQTEEMWSTMLEESKDVEAESEAVHGLLSLDSGALSVCKTLESFIQTESYARVRMEAILALAKITGQENAFEGVEFLTEFCRSRCFNPTTSLPKPNAFVDLSELLVDQTLPIALGSMRDIDGQTPKEALDLILKVLEYNNNEDNDFDDSEWLAAWLHGLEKVVTKDKEAWKSIFKVVQRCLSRDSLFPSRHQCVTQSCLNVLGSATLHQPMDVKIKMLPILAKYVNVDKYEAKTRAVAGQVVTQVAASLNGPDTAIFNALNWLPSEPCAYVREAVFRKMLSLINLLGNKARGKDGIQWRTVDVLYKYMVNRSLPGYFRYYCLMVLLAVSDEPQTLYRAPDDWILKTQTEAAPQVAEEPVRIKEEPVRTEEPVRKAPPASTSQQRPKKKLRVTIKPEPTYI